MNQQRIAYPRELPAVHRAMVALHHEVDNSGLPPRLVELMKIRASQLNGCAFCVDMHVKDALAIGEDARRLHLLAVWRESGLFTAAEAAALGWTEALTRLHPDGAPDPLYEELTRHFTEREVVALTWVVATINAWNRLGVAMKQPAGEYVSSRTVAQQ